MSSYIAADLSVSLYTLKLKERHKQWVDGGLKRMSPALMLM